MNQPYLNQAPLPSSGPPVSMNARDLLSILWRRSWVVLVIMAISLALTWYVSKRTPPRWKATAQLLLVQRTAPIGPPGSSVTGPVVETTETQVALLQSYEVAHRTISLLKDEALERGETFTPITEEAFQKQLTVTNQPGTNLLEINVEAESASRARELADALCKSFLEYKTRTNKATSADTISDLENREKRARNKMLEADREEILFKQRNHLADVPTQISAAINQYLLRDAEVATLKQDLLSNQAKTESLKKQLTAANIAIGGSEGVRDDTLVTALQKKLSDLETQRTEMAQKYTSEFPGMLNDLDAQITDIKTRLKDAIQSTIDINKPSLQSQALLLDEYKQAETTLRYTQAKFDAAVRLRDRLRAETGSLPQKSIEYARLAKNAETARSLHTAIQQALQTINLDTDMSSGNVQIAQHAHAPEKPFLPNTSRDLTFGGTIGLFLSLVGMLLLEQSDHRVRRVDQVKRLVSGPIVGALPQLTPWQVRAMLAGENTAQVEETYGLARANLGLVLRQVRAGDPWNHTLILVTSALPGEGKSVTSAQLARSLARSGRSVILVDADMRRPTQSRLFNTTSETGLADLLMGHMMVEEVLAISDTPNLLIIHSGRPLRNPTELLSMPNLPEILNSLREQADVVIIDSPACAGVADALFLAPYADCIMHVIRTGKADTDTVEETIAALQAANPACMVFFVNSAPRERNTAYTAYKYYQSYNTSQQKPQQTSEQTKKGTDTSTALPILPRASHVQNRVQNRVQNGVQNGAQPEPTITDAPPQHQTPGDGEPTGDLPVCGIDRHASNGSPGANGASRANGTNGTN